MRTLTLTAYKFSELSKESKQRAIDKHRDGQLDYDWWQFTYEDAAEVGLKITGFDLAGRNDISGELTMSAKECADTIRENHGEHCDTYKAATEFLTKCQPVMVTAKLLGTDEAEQEADEQIEELAEEFKKELLKCYWNHLEEECEYL